MITVHKKAHFGSHLGFSNGQSGRFDEYLQKNHHTKFGACITICTFVLFSVLNWNGQSVLMRS